MASTGPIESTQNHRSPARSRSVPEEEVRGLRPGAVAR
jgi:hypothetical protein